MAGGCTEAKAAEEYRCTTIPELRATWQGESVESLQWASTQIQIEINTYKILAIEARLDGYKDRRWRFTKIADCNIHERNVIDQLIKEKKHETKN